METWNLVLEWTGGWRCIREACAFQSLQHPEITQWWLCSQYQQTDGPHKPWHHWWELCMQWCWWARARWQRQDEGILMSTMLDCSVSCLSGQVVSSPRSLLLLFPLPVCPRPCSAKHQQDEMQQGWCPIWHHSWVAESCCWGNSWASKTTHRGCFQDGQLHPEPL